AARRTSVRTASSESGNARSAGRNRSDSDQLHHSPPIGPPSAIVTPAPPPGHAALPRYPRPAPRTPGARITRAALGTPQQGGTARVAKGENGAPDSAAGPDSGDTHRRQRRRPGDRGD